MTRLQLLLVAIALLLTAPLAFRVSGARTETVSARELVDLALVRSRNSYTVDQPTDRALKATRVERPAADADLAAIEGRLHDAGFVLSPLGKDGTVLRVELARK